MYLYPLFSVIWSATHAIHECALQNPHKKITSTSICSQVVGLGVLGKEGSGRLRMVANQSKLKISAKNAKKARQSGYGGATSGLQTSGLQTSLAFTPVQVCEIWANLEIGL